MESNALYTSLQEMFRKALLVVPNIAAAIAILVIGYIVARILKAVVVRLLTSSKLFAKAEELKMPPKERPAEMIGTVVFYFIMLLVLLAFFNVLDLPIIAAPISTLVGTVMAYLPKLGGAAAILIVAWIIARILRMIIVKGLGAVKFDEKVSKYVKAQEGKGPSEIIGAIVFYLVLLFALPPFLEALQLGSIMNPVSAMWGKIAGILPNLLAAAIIIVIGLFIAKIVREIVVNLLAALGVDRVAEGKEKGKGLEGLKASGIIGTVLYVLVLIPVIIAALDALNIPSISTPLASMLTVLLNKLPAIFAASIIIVLALVLGKVIQKLVTQILAGLGFNRLMESLGFRQMGSKAPSDLVGLAAFVYILFFAVMEGAEILDFKMLSNLTQGLTVFAFRVVLAVVILVVGILVGNWVKQLLQGTAKDKPFLAKLAKAAIVVFALAVALQNLGIANEIILIAFGLLFGSVAVAAAIAFGVGSRETAGREVEAWVRKMKE